MTQFLIRRAIGLLFVLISVSFITFILGYFSPTDPIRVLLGQHYTLTAYLRLRHTYGFDLPWYMQYYNYVVNLLHFNLGNSIRSQDRSVWDILKDGVPISVEIAFWGLIGAILLGIPAGIISAVRANSWIDTTNMSIALVLYALPVFVIAVFAQVIIVWINVNFNQSWPVSDWGTPWQYTLADLQFKIVPIVIYAATSYAYFARLARTSMLEVLRQDYVRTARAKGLSERVVIYKHALRNALLPLITAIGYYVGFLVVGALFIERVFNIPGISSIIINAIGSNDFPVVQATTLLTAVGVVFGNLIADILYTVVDPRIKLA
jgi:ABC-type dipeptide/oligopeptide/nickel transport system permease component